VTIYDGCGSGYFEAFHELEDWQTAIESLIGAAEDRDYMLHARIGVLRALNRHVERTFQSWSQGHALGKAQAEERL
jgi:hypothetical protein